jgi:hypothetical protein
MKTEDETTQNVTGVQNTPLHNPDDSTTQVTKDLVNCVSCQRPDTEVCFRHRCDRPGAGA